MSQLICQGFLKELSFLGNRDVSNSIIIATLSIHNSEIFWNLWLAAHWCPVLFWPVCLLFSEPFHPLRAFKNSSLTPPLTIWTQKPASTLYCEIKGYYHMKHKTMLINISICRTMWYRSGINLLSLMGKSRMLSRKQSLYPWSFFSEAPKIVKYQWHINWTTNQSTRIPKRIHLPLDWKQWNEIKPRLYKHSIKNSALFNPTPSTRRLFPILYVMIHPRNHIHKAIWAINAITTVTPPWEDIFKVIVTASLQKYLP